MQNGEMLVVVVMQKNQLVGDNWREQVDGLGSKICWMRDKNESARGVSYYHLLNVYLHGNGDEEGCC